MVPVKFLPPNPTVSQQSNDHGNRRKSAFAAMGDRLILQYLAGPDRVISFYKYCDKNAHYLGQKNTKQRKSSENRKIELRRKLVRVPETFIDHLLHFGLDDLAKDTEENLESLVRFHMKAIERNRKGRSTAKRLSDSSDDSSSQKAEKQPSYALTSIKGENQTSSAIEQDRDNNDAH